MNQTLKKYLTLIVLGLAGGSIYIFPYLKYVFYDPLIHVLHISNAQSGMLLTMYAIGCVILYIPGGILADKVNPKKALILSLLATSALTIIFAVIIFLGLPGSVSFGISLVIWLLLAFGSGFVFWTALLKAIRIIGTEEEQGRMYGVYYAANGTTDKDISTAEEDKFHFSDIGEVVKNPAVWLVSIMFFCIYGVYSCSSYFTPYLTDIVGLSTTVAGACSVIRTYVVMLIAAPLGGILADKIFKSTLNWFRFGGTILAFSIALVILVGSQAPAMLIAVLTLIPGLFSMCLYGVMFSTMHEINIPIKVAGTAIGIASIIGYLPDMFLSTFFGSILDKAQGAAGYMQIFEILAVFCVIVVVISCFLYTKYVKKAK